MKFLVFSLILCFNFFTIHAQEEPSVRSNNNYIIVNGAGCSNCTTERSKASIQELILNIDKKFVDIKSFKVKIPGQPTLKIYGDRTKMKYKKALKRVKIGDKIQIFDVKTEKGNLKSYIIIKIIE